MSKSLRAIAAAVALLATSAPSLALTVDNITYTLTDVFVSADGATETHSLTLDILNHSTDGRTAITSFAFNLPTGFVSASLPDWITHSGGLNASGCNGKGNFFCFSGYAAAEQTMSFTFSLTAAAGAFENYAPDFKIDWIGSRNNYDLVSQILPATSAPPVAAVPEPETYALLLAGLGIVGAVARRRQPA